MIANLQRFAELSPPRQKLVRMCQTLNFGQIMGIIIQNGEPLFDPAPVVLAETLLDRADERRPEINLADFVLPAEALRLMIRLDEVSNGTIERLEVRSGVPRRLIFESRLIDSSIEPRKYIEDGREPNG